MKEQIRELVKATLIIGAKRGRTDYPTTEELEPLIEQHIDSMTERFLKLLPQGDVRTSYSARQLMNYPIWLIENGFVLDPFMRKGFDQRTYIRLGVNQTPLTELQVFDMYLKSVG